MRASAAIRYAATSTAAGRGRGEAVGLRPSSVVGQRLGLLAQRADQAAVVERGGPQLVHQAAYVGDHLADVRRWSPRAALRPRLGVAVDQEPRRLEPEHHAGQGRPETVVQVAADAAPLLLTGEDHLLAAQLQLVGHAAGPGRGRGLPDEVAEQRLVARREPAAQSRGRGGRAARWESR